jgi:hypothetical protein
MLTGREVIDHPLNRRVETFRRQHQSPKAEDQNPQPRRDGQAKSQKRKKCSSRHVKTSPALE